MRSIITAGVACAGWLVQSASALASPLIVTEEAALPDAAAGLVTRGIGQGPGIKIASPADGAALKLLYVLKLDFESRGGVQIDPA